MKTGNYHPPLVSPRYSRTEGEVLQTARGCPALSDSVILCLQMDGKDLASQQHKPDLVAVICTVERRTRKVLAFSL